MKNTGWSVVGLGPDKHFMANMAAMEGGDL